MQNGKHWVGTWTMSPAQAETGAFNNHTLRMTMRASLGGSEVRVRISNAYGNRPLAVGGAHIALRDKGAAIQPGSDRKLAFGGEPGATIAAGSLLISDPVGLDLPPLADLAVSLYLPGEVPNDFQVTGRYARQTSYISPPGDFTGAAVMPIGSITSDWFFVSGIDVAASSGTSGVVALGDSLTDGNISTMDAFCRWPDQLARRLAQAGKPVAVMNQGLGGNRILHDIRGDSGLRRFDRDVLAQPGVTHVVVMLGTNDLRNRWKKPEEEMTDPAGMIAGLKQMAVRAHTVQIKIIGATLTPFGNETYMANAWNPTRETHRVAVNAWIRGSGVLDGVADFDAALRDPEIPTQMRGVDDCGDGLHPSDSGYCKMGDVIDLALLD